MTAHAISSAPDPHPSSGGRLVALDGRALALEGTAIRAEASGGLARVVLEQRFRNVHADPLRALYQVPLPPDAAVSGYAFRIGERRVVGEVDRKQAARERFEEALIEGRTAGLFEQDRSSLFSQEIGNIPPGVSIVAEITIDQRLRWLDEGAWEWRFPTVVAPRYLGSPDDTPDSARVSVDVADPAGAPLTARAQLRLSIGDVLTEGGAPSSPSHALSTSPAESTKAEHVLSFAEGDARLDRDLVVRWPVATARAGVSILTGRPAAGRGAGDDCGFGLLTLVPPLPDARGAAWPRDLVVLMDTSGSMNGEPLEQAKRVVRALIERLDDTDRLELIEFSTEPRRWKSGAVIANAPARADAVAWVDRLRAGGATEMVSGILEALRAKRDDAQRQVILVTDGLIGFEDQVVREIVRSEPRARVHTVGIGSSVNRSLTAAAARAGRGVEVLIGLGEDAAPAIERLLARTSEPLVTDLGIEGPALMEHAPAALPDLFGGAPALVALKLRPEGGSLVVRGVRLGGAWEQRIDVPAIAVGSGRAAVPALYARERVEDLETIAATGQSVAVDTEIELLGLGFQIATRLTSWVAISDEPTVDASQPTRRERIPHELAHGICAEGLGLQRVHSARHLPLHGLTAADMEAQVRQSLQTLLPREERVIKMRFGIGDRVDASLEKVGADFDATRERIREIEAKALRRLRHPSRSKLLKTTLEDGAPLAGRVVLRARRRLVIEIELIDALVWKPASAKVSLVLADGRSLEATLDLFYTTRKGRHASGQTLRLTLDTNEDIAETEPREILLENAKQQMRIQLEA